MILFWLQKYFPGRVEETERWLRIWHDSHDTTTLWRRPPGRAASSKGPLCLNGFYDDFEAADIMSSTFKISSPDVEIIENGVHLVYSQAQLVSVVQEASVPFPSGTVPFMMQTGMWVYAFSAKNSHIIEWDLEYGEPGETYPDLVSVMEEWRRAILEK